MRRGAAAGMVAVWVLAVCGGQPTPIALPAASPTVVATVARSATPAASASSSPTVKPTPLVSATGGILVREPLPGDHAQSPLTISGDASVFEGTVAWRIVTAGGQVLAEGNTQASIGAPQKGTFKVQIPFTAPYYSESGSVEVFERSPKDGTIAQIVRVPVTIDGAY